MLPRDQIADIYTSTIEANLAYSKPIIKLINFGTGSGKTHQLFQSVFSTIQKHPDIHIIGLYVAPLREHLSVPQTLRAQYSQIPCYILFSQDWKTSDDFIRDYKKWIPSILKDQKLLSRLHKETKKDKVNDARQSLLRAQSAVGRLEYLRRFSANDEKAKRDIEQAQRDITGGLERFLELFIKSQPDETQWANLYYDMVSIFYPLYLLREKSGILLMTYDKFETQIPYFKHNDSRWVKKGDYFDRYVIAYSENTRFIVAFDEQEDGYQIMLDHQIDIISPKDLAINNALSSIAREFSVLFSQNSGISEFLKFLNNNPGALAEFTEHIEKGKRLEPKFAKWAEIFRRLAYDEGNSDNFLLHLARIYEGLEEALKLIVTTYRNFGDVKTVDIDFDMLSRVLDVFENTRSLVIPQKLYAKFSEDLMNIFSYNNLYIYNIDVLRDLLLDRKNSGHVHILEKGERQGVTVAELIYAILAVRPEIVKIKSLLENVLGAEDSQSRSLDIWSRQISRVQKAGEEASSETKPIKYLNRQYVYQSLKSIINIMEISRYQTSQNNLINHPLREVSIGSTAILTSPEHRILSMLEGTGNLIFLISATGGVYGDLSTNYDLHYLEDKLRDASGLSSFYPMQENELAISEQIRQSRLSNRQISVQFFTSDIHSFPNIRTKEVVERFENTVLKDYLNSKQKDNWGIGPYKVQELQNFIRHLFYLFEDNDIQETIAFTQTLTWIKQLLAFAEHLHFADYQFIQSKKHPNIYKVQLGRKVFASSISVKLILYESSFNKSYINATSHTYLDELQEEDGQKIFFVSAYQSASKGLNPTVKTKEMKEKDFDVLVLLMDRYFSVITPSSSKKRDKSAEKSITLLHFALMKNIVSSGDSTLEIKDFNRYLSEPESIDFQMRQHQIQLGKGILQAIGRSERRDYPGQTIKIFINDETRKNLVNYYRYLRHEEPNEFRKLSVNNFAVYQRIQDEERKITIQNYNEHVFSEIDATVAFQGYREWMLNEVDRLHEDNRGIKIVELWEMLRDPLAAQNPAQFIEMLQSSRHFPEDFVASLFYHNSNQPDFIPFLVEESDNRHRYKIISDSIHGEKLYTYKSRLVPDYLKVSVKGYDAEGEPISGVIDPSTDQILKLYRRFVPDLEVFNEYIPRPDFFYDVLYPSLAENMVEAWIKNVIFSGKDWKLIRVQNRLESLSDFKTYHKLFERFDLFFTKDDVLHCIDVKAWSITSGYRLSQKTIEKAQQKLIEIKADHPEFSEVRGLLLNLFAPVEKNNRHPSNLFSGNLFYLDSDRSPVESSILRNFLFEKG